MVSVYLRRILTVVALLGITTLSGQNTRAYAQAPNARGTVSVAAAADLKAPMDEIAREFQKQTGYAIRASYGASGTLFAQISNGAPFDVLMSADTEYPRKLAEAGQANADTQRVYARGTLVLWTSKPWNDQKNHKTLRELGINAVLDPSVHRVAIANPAHAPYGRAAEAALRKAGVLDTVRPKLVTAENVAQTAQFVESGNADAGFVALTAVLARNAEISPDSWMKVPQNLYPPIDQAAIVTRTGQNRPGVREFMDFLATPPVKSILQRYGFADPTAATDERPQSFTKSPRNSATSPRKSAKPPQKAR